MNPRLLQVIKGLAKISGHVTKRSPPVLLSHVKYFVAHALRKEASYDDALVAMLSVVAFFGVMRLGKLSEAPVKLDRDVRKLISRASFTSSGVKTASFVLPHHKADRYFKSSMVVFTSASSPPAFIKLLLLYISYHDKSFPTSTPLFIRSDRSIPSRCWFLSHLHTIAPSVTRHSF